MNKNIVSIELTGFGYRELGMAAELIEAYADNPPAFLGYGGDGLHLEWNNESDMMWLRDDDYTMGVLEEKDGKKRIVQFFNCSNCGYEGTQEDALADSRTNSQGKEKDFEKYKGYCLAECAKKNGVEIDDEDEDEDGETDYADDREVKRDFDRFRYE